MTFVLSVHGRDSFWIVTDRRLSFGKHRPPIDDAVKITELETIDGVGVLAYAGLGATPRGNQPSQWMANTLRGHGGLNFETALGILSDAATRELPRHLRRTPGGAHLIVVPAFVRGVGPRLYIIENVIDPKTGQHRYSSLRIQRTLEPHSRPPPIMATGSGAFYLQGKPPAWKRELIRLVRAHDRRKVSDLVIADYLARLNYEIHLGTRDGTVGPKSIVIWRRSPDAKKLMLGGGYQFYNGVNRTDETVPVPAIANGLDSKAISQTLIQHILGQLAGYESGPLPLLDLSSPEFIRKLDAIPSDPDDRLR